MSETRNEAEAPSEYMLDLTKGPDKVDETPNPTEAQPQQDELPDKFKGKSPKEIVDAYRNLETELGRARNEIGTMRRLSDELLGIRTAGAQPTTPQPPARAKLTPDDILADPEASVIAVAKEVSNVRADEQEIRLARLEYDLTLGRFEQKHPEYKDVMADPAFAAWVQKSPLRARLATATVNGDFASADELFTLYSEATAGAGTVQQQQAPDPTDQARKASLTRPGSSAAPASGSPSNAGKPIWSRQKLLDMRINNPEEFERLQPQILQAYAEKRVR